MSDGSLTDDDNEARMLGEDDGWWWMLVLVLLLLALLLSRWCRVAAGAGAGAGAATNAGLGLGLGACSVSLSLFPPPNPSPSTSLGSPNPASRYQRPAGACAHASRISHVTFCISHLQRRMSACSQQPAGRGTWLGPCTREYGTNLYAALGMGMARHGEARERAGRPDLGSRCSGGQDKGY
ncbi:hypothetical protein K431DRAFT_100840 [Polychaeton citri CBS 116435]|uniref:Uncharacterized protein n=1 Tax=Polychaeton citri CBS 116435 TaxID=1314669 RepID=A0A9P4QI66_9PEZI|nr:hypothetical protein K431DRAFT_100840 [Polychaeton citri CBS 116435]